MIDLLIETLIKAGSVIYFIFLISIYAWYLIVEKARFINREGKDGRIFARKISGHFDKKERKHLINYLNNENRLIARELVTAVDTNKKSISAPELEGIKIYYHEILDRNIGTIGTLSALAPLLGLLGTVIGMMKTFGVIKLFGSANPALMAEGISEALLTTQAGLVVAFPIVLANTFLKNRIKEVKDNFEKIRMKITGEAHV